MRTFAAKISLFVLVFVGGESQGIVERMDRSRMALGEQIANHVQTQLGNVFVRNQFPIPIEQRCYPEGGVYQVKKEIVQTPKTPLSTITNYILTPLSVTTTSISHQPTKTIISPSAAIKNNPLPSHTTTTNTNIISGLNNAVTGQYNILSGNSNSLIGSNNLALGHKNSITGSTNTVSANKAIVKGNMNRVIETDIDIDSLF